MVSIPAGAKIVTSRALNVEHGGHIANGSKHVVDSAIENGYTIFDNVAEQAVHDTVHQGIQMNDPFIFYGAGHGNETTFTGDNLDVIFTTADCEILAGRLVNLHSCSTGSRLGPEIIKKGGSSFLGFVKDWGWLAGDDIDTNDPNADPYDCIYAKPFWESANQYMISLFTGRETKRAYMECYEKYNEWIEYWKESDDPGAAQIIGLLAYDRDIMVLIEEILPSPPPSQPLWKPIVAMLPIFGIGLVVNQWDEITKLFTQ